MHALHHAFASRMWRATNAQHCVGYARDSRKIRAYHASVARIPRKDNATKDVTFGHICLLFHTKLSYETFFHDGEHSKPCIIEQSSNKN
jgi:hypothetical protein